MPCKSKSMWCDFMGMYLAISKGVGYCVSEGIFECIVESTRRLFKNGENSCLEKIYVPFDEQGQNFIALNDVDVECFNLFYSYCKQAMISFPVSERGKELPENRIPIVLSHWSEFMRLMKEDPRCRERLRLLSLSPEVLRV